MKRIAALFSSSVGIAVFALAGVAQALPAQAQPAKAPSSTTTRTSDYVESQTGGDQVIKFTGDELAGPAGGMYGDMIRRPPGAIRQLLIRPRFNFISELRASVENI